MLLEIAGRRDDAVAQALGDHFDIHVCLQSERCEDVPKIVAAVSASRDNRVPLCQTWWHTRVEKDDAQLSEPLFSPQGEDGMNGWASFRKSSGSLDTSSAGWRRF